MSLLNKAGSILRQTANRQSIHHAMRCASSSSSMGGSNSYLTDLGAKSGKVEGKNFMDHQLVRLNYAIIGNADKFGVGQRRSISSGNTKSRAESTTSAKLARIAASYLPSLTLFPHINSGIEEIMADYVHQKMTREFILLSFRLFLIIVAKDFFVTLAF